MTADDDLAVERAAMVGGMRLTWVRVALAVTTTALTVSGCGGNDGTATPAPALASPSTAAPSATTPTGKQWSAKGPTFGVTSASWPTSAPAAAEVLERMPEKLDGQSRRVLSSDGVDGEDRYGAEASLTYGDPDDISVSVSEAYVSQEDGETYPISARDALAARFMLGLACGEESYRGNALPLSDEGYPKVKRGEPVWFSCAVDGAEGEEDYRAHAVGWVNGKTAWLVITPTANKTRTLVTLLHDAAN